MANPGQTNLESRLRILESRIRNEEKIVGLPRPPKVHLREPVNATQLCQYEKNLENRMYALEKEYEIRKLEINIMRLIELDNNPIYGSDALRLDVRKEIASIIGNNQHPFKERNIIAIAGPGGSGKSYIADRACMDTLGVADSWAWAWRLCAMNEETLYKDYKELLLVLQELRDTPASSSINSMTLTDLASHIWDILTNDLTHIRWTLIFDNAPEEGPDAIIPWFFSVPLQWNGSKGNIIFTTRSQNYTHDNVFGQDVNEIHVGPLDMESAVNILRLPPMKPTCQADVDETEKEFEWAKKIVTALDMLVLPITEFSHYMVENNLSIQECHDKLFQGPDTMSDIEKMRMNL